MVTYNFVLVNFLVFFFVSFFIFHKLPLVLFLHHLFYSQIEIAGTLCAHFLLNFYADSLKLHRC